MVPFGLQDSRQRNTRRSAGSKLVRPRARLSDPTGPMPYGYTNFPQILMEPRQRNAGNLGRRHDDNQRGQHLDGIRSAGRPQLRLGEHQPTHPIHGHGAQQGSKYVRVEYWYRYQLRWQQRTALGSIWTVRRSTRIPTTELRFYTNGGHHGYSNYYVWRDFVRSTASTVQHGTTQPTFISITATTTNMRSTASATTT
jgi:hypothetical protein